MADKGHRRRQTAGDDRRHARDDGPRPVVASLADAARLLGAEGAVSLAAVRENWAVAVGAQVASHCWPVSLEGGRLMVATDHPAWATELRVLSGQLLGQIRSVAPEVASLAVQVSPHRGRDW